MLFMGSAVRYRQLERRFKMIEAYEVIELPIDEVIEIFGLD